MELNYKQFKKLEGVWFWIRELKISLEFGDNEKHINSVRNAISTRIEECDSLQIPFTVQNKVLTHSDVYDDIRDILRSNNIKYKTA